MSSNNVDDRVVKMTFDNDQFEAGVKQTLTSLEELKESLKFNNSLTGIQAVSSAFNSFSLSNISSQLESLTSRFSTLGIVGMTAIENITNKVINFTTSKMQSTLGQITSGGWARASSIAQSRFTLQGLLNDEEKVQQAFDSASNAVDGTAYNLNSAVAAASQLAASGVDVGEDMENTLKGIAGTAAMTGDSFDSIANIFTTVAGNGRLMGMQLTQLSAHGLNAAATIADYLGTTEAEVRDMTSKGEISFETFSAAMQSAFGEHAKDANKTFSGSMDNIKSALSRIGAIFSSGIIENDDLINALNNIRLTINSIKNAMMPLETSFKTLVSSASKLFSSVLGDVKFDSFEKFVDCVGKAMEYVASLMDRWTELNEKFKSSVLGIVAEETKEAAEDIYAATELVTAAWDIWNYNSYGTGAYRRAKLTEEFGEEQATIVQQLVNQIAAGNTDIAHYAINDLLEVEDAADEVSESMEGIGNSVKTVEPPIVPLVAIMKSLGHYASGFKTIWTNTITILTKTVTSFKKIFSWKDLTQDIADYGDMFSNLVGYFALTDERAEKLETVLTGLWSAFDLVRMVVKSVAGGLSKILGPVLSVQYDLILSFVAKVAELITKFQQWYRENDILKSIMETLGTVISKVIEYTSTFFKKLDQLPAVQKIKDALKEFAELIGDKLIGYFGDAQEATEKFFGSLEDADDNPKMEEVLNNINGVLENLITFCSDAKEAVKDFSDWTSKKISGLLGFNDGLTNTEDKLTKLKSAGEKVASSKSLGEFISNISETMSKFGFGIDKVTDWIIEKFNSLDAAKIAVMGLGSSLTVFGLSLSYLSYNVAEFVKTFTAFPMELVNTVRSFRQVFTGIQQYLKNDSQAKVLKAWAIAIGVLAASLFILTNYTDHDKLLDVIEGLGVLMLVMAISVQLMTSTAAKMGSEKGFFKTLSAISLMFVAIAASAFILTEALRNLNGLDWDKSIIGPCVALVFILGALVAVVVVASKLDLDNSLAKTGLGIALFSAGVWLVAQAFKVLNDVELDGIYDKVFALIGIMSTLAVFSVVASRLSFSNAVGVLLLVGSIFLIELALKDILYNGVSLNDIAEHMDRFGTVLIALAVIAGFMVVVGLTCKKASNIAVNIIATAVSIYIVVKAIENLAEVPFTGILKALFTITIIFFGIRVLINQLSANQIASNAGKNLIKISIAIAILSAVVGIIGNLPITTLGKGLLVVTILTALVAGLIYVSQFAKNIDYKALYAIVVAIGVMALVVALLSFIKDLESVYAAAGIMSLMMLSLGMSLYLAGKYAKRLQTSHLVVMVTALVLIAGSLFLLSQYGDIGKMITAALSICGVMLVIAASLALIKKAMGSTDFGKNNRISMMILMISLLAVVAAALYILGKNDPTSTGTAALAIIAVFYVVVSELSKLTNSIKGSKFDTTTLLVLASIGLIIGVIAASLYIVLTATKDMPFENILASVLAMGGLLLAVAGITNYLSNITSTYNVSTFATVVSVCALLLVVAYSLKMVLETGINWQEMIGAAIAMLIVIGTVAAVVGALSAIGESGIGLVAIIVVAAALSVTMLALGYSMKLAAQAMVILVQALKELVTVDFSPITENLGTLWQLVLIFAAIAFTSSIFGVGLVAVGVGLAAVGLGAAVIVASLAALAAIIIVTLAATSNFVLALTALINTFKTSKGEIQSGISEIGTGLANAITNFTQTLADNSETIASNISRILLNVLTAFIEFRNKAIVVIAEGILKFLDIVDEYGPQIADKATKTLLDILTSLAQNATKIAVVGAYLVSAFVVGVFNGLASKIGDILQAAMGFAISFIYGIADTIYENTQPLIDSMKYLGLVLVRELIAAFNIGGVFNESLEAIDGEIAYQKSLREEQGAEAKEAFNDGVNSVDNAEISNVDTSGAVQSSKEGGKESGEGFGDSFKDYATDKISEFTGSDTLSLDGITDQFGLTGTDSANAFVSNLNTGVQESKVDVSSINDDVKNQLLSEDYEYDETGQYLVKKIETSINTESEDINLDDTNDNILNSLISEDDTTTKGEEGLEWFVSGFENLDDSQQSRLFEVGEKIGNAVYDGAASATETSSPSRKAMYLRDMFVEGLTLIGSDLTTKITTAYGDVGTEAVDAVANSMSSISNVIQDESLDWTPTLSPVIDGSQLQNGSNLLTATFGNSALNLAADTALSVKDANANSLAEQVAYLSDQVKKLADTDYSEMLKGVNINVNSQTNVDGTPLRKMASSYTIQQIDEQQTSYNLSRGARA